MTEEEYNSLMALGACCGCDESKELLRQLRKAEAERDYLAAFHDPSELQQMRQHLAAQWEAKPCAAK